MRQQQKVQNSCDLGATPDSTKVSVGRNFPQKLVEMRNKAERE